MTRDKWKAEYVRLALASGHDLTEADAREEADDSWIYWNEAKGSAPMPAPFEIIREDMREWGQR